MRDRSQAIARPTNRCWAWPIRPRARLERPDWRDWAGKPAPGTVFDQPEPEELIELTVIVPARNEEDCLGACLQVAGQPVGRDFRAGPRLGTDRGRRSLDRPDGRDRARHLPASRCCRRASWSPAGRARPTPCGRRRGGRAAAGCSLPMPTRSTSRATCAAQCTRRSGTRWAC